MAQQEKLSTAEHPNRRHFLKTSMAAAAGAAAVGGLSLARGAHAAGSDVIRFGLIGCGGRGPGAAVDAMTADRGTRLVAMSDIFADKVQSRREMLKKQKPEQVQVDDAHCFSGLDGYRHVIESSDVVLIACAAKYHPVYLRAAIEAGKHVFVEKPHAVDPVGVREVTAACELAKQKKLSVMSGLHSRYEPGYIEAMKRIHDGAIGEIVSIEENFLRGPFGLCYRQPNQKEVQYQFANQYHFAWLSGDDVVQSLVHNLDRATWAMHEQTPVKAHGLGGRSSSFGEVYGNIFDHHSVVYEYANGVRMYALTRTQNGCYNEYSSAIFGTKGRFYSFPVSLLDHGREALEDVVEAGPPRTGARGPVRGHSLRQSRECRRLHGPQHVGGRHGPIDLLLRARADVGPGRQVELCLHAQGRGGEPGHGHRDQAGRQGHLSRPDAGDHGFQHLGRFAENSRRREKPRHCNGGAFGSGTKFPEDVLGHGFGRPATDLTLDQCLLVWQTVGDDFFPTALPFYSVSPALRIASMTQPERLPTVRHPNRRDFLKTSMAGAAAAATIGGLSLARSAHAAGSEVIRVGLVGCGGRGPGAAINAMNVDRGVRLVAMTDIFADKVQSRREMLKQQKPAQVQVDDAHCFSGLDGYRHVIESADVVLIACAAKYHCYYLHAAVEAGKHVFVEKPHAIDPVGVRQIAVACAPGQAEETERHVGPPKSLSSRLSGDRQTHP